MPLSPSHGEITGRCKPFFTSRNIKKTTKPPKKCVAWNPRKFNLQPYPQLAHNTQELCVFQVVGYYPWWVEVTSPRVCVRALECRGQTFGWPGHQSLVKCWNDSSPEGEQTALAIALPSSSCQHPADWHTHTHTHTHTHSLSLSMTQRPVLPKPLTGDVKVNYFKMCADKSVSTRRGKNNKSASFGQPNAKNINTLLHRLSGSLMQFSSLPLAAGYWPLNLIWIRTPISSISEHAVCPTLI